MTGDSSLRGSKHGRNPIRNTDVGWTILLGLHTGPRSPSTLLRMDHRMVRFGKEYAVGISANQSDRFNLIGQIAVTTGIDFGLAQLISTTAVVSNGYHATPGKTLGILAVILFSQAAVNFASTHKLRYLIYTSILLNVGGVLCLMIAVLAKAKTHQSAAFVFTKFFDGTGQDGPGWSVRASSSYVAVIGLLMAQFTILGFDSSVSPCQVLLSNFKCCVRKILCFHRPTHVSLGNAYKSTVYRRIFVKKPGKQFEMLQLPCCHPLRLRVFSDFSFLRASFRPFKTSMPSVRILYQS